MSALIRVIFREIYVANIAEAQRLIINVIGVALDLQCFFIVLKGFVVIAARLVKARRG